MKTVIKRNFIFILLSFISLSIEAQGNLPNWELGGNIGFTAYQGDLSPSGLGSYKTLKPTIVLSASKIFSEKIKLRTALTIGQFKGDESKFSAPAYRRLRNLSFTTSFEEVSEVVIWNFLESAGQSEPKIISPYIFGGVGISFLNVKRNANNVSPILIAIEPKIATDLAQDLSTPTPKSIWVLPVGVGANFNITEQISLNAELNFRYSKNDYLDGFSKVANPKKNDYYYGATVGISYKL